MTGSLPTGHGWRRVLLGCCRGLVLPVPDPPAWWIRLGGYEPEIGSWISRLVREGDLVADIGSAWGYYAAAFAKRGAMVLAADLDEDLAQLTRRALDRNGYGGIVDHAEVTSLPAGIDAAKLDVEGAEADILRASEDVLMHDSPTLLIEVHSRDSLLTCVEILSWHRYTTHKIPLQASWARRSYGEHRGWLAAWKPAGDLQ